jgi:hypothetical protein
MEVKEEKGELMFSPFYRLLISLFILFYFTSVTIGLLPDSPLRSRVIDWSWMVDSLLGVEQNWQMFCPTVRDLNFHISAIITFADGTSTLWEFPRFDNTSFWFCFTRSRLRKQLNDNLIWDDFASFHPAIARYIARCYVDPKNQPVKVSLAYNWFKVPPIEEAPDRLHLPQHIHRYTFFVYAVRPEDLR